MNARAKFKRTIAIILAGMTAGYAAVAVSTAVLLPGSYWWMYIYILVVAIVSYAAIGAITWVALHEGGGSHEDR